MGRNSIAVRSVRSLFAVSLLFAGACGGAPGEDADPELIGEASLAVTTVPSGVQCIEVVATGSKTVTKDFTTTSGSSSVDLAVGRLPLGTVKFTASAFDVACTALSGATATWNADPASAVLKAGVVSKITMSFRKVNPTTVTANFIDNVAGIASGYFATYLLMADGTIRASGSTPFASSKVFSNPLSTFTKVAEIAPGETHVCFRKTDGTVWCAGGSANGQVGPGIPVGSSTSTPVLVPLPGSATQVVAGGGFSCAVVMDQPYCWGANDSGQLGDGTFTQSSTPVVVGTFGHGGFLAAGYSHACYSTGSDTRCWGRNVLGQLGDNTTTNRATPVQVVQLGATVSLDLGAQHSCAVRGDGTLRCWGNNPGALGDGTTTNRLVPTLVPGLTDVTQVSGSSFATCALRQTGNVSCWGLNFNGEVGDGTGEMQMSPKEVAGLSNVQAISLGGYHVCALLGDQTVRCWGDNAFNMLGDGTSIKRFRPVVSTVQ